MQKNIWIAAKYLRLSIEDGDKAESESIVNQSILIDNYMKSTSDITIVETFKDDGFSGTDFKRPGFQAMLKAIENKEINCIIVKDLSRFGREHIDVDRYIQKVFPQLGVRFIAINDNYDSETANITDTHLVLPVKSFVNDTYCRQNSQKVRSHLSAKRNIGEYVGNYVSYGYKKCDADKSQIEIDPVAAKHVRDIFNWKMEGMSNQLIADKLNELGVLAPAAALELPDGRIVTGKTSDLLGASAALILNALKELAGIDHDMHLISPTALEPIQKVKTEFLGSKNPRLHIDEALIALSISASSNPVAEQALRQVPNLKGCQAHVSVMLANVDIRLFQKLSIQVTSEPRYEKKPIYQ